MATIKLVVVATIPVVVAVKVYENESLTVTTADNSLVISGKGQDDPGDTGFTTIIRTSESVPQSVVAEIATLKIPVCVGVPEITPVVVEKERP